MTRGPLTCGFFVTGTDTGVGKTRVAVALIGGLVNSGKRVVGMKPVASGCESRAGGLVNDDALALIAASNVNVRYEEVNPYCFAPAIAPHIAARQAGVVIDRAYIRTSYESLAARADCIVVEGAGGWLVPVTPDATMADIARDCGLPVVLVVGLRLGCINHALLTAQSIALTGLELAGWVANDPAPAMPERAASVAEITKRIAAPCLADIPFGARPVALAVR
jgi:dethiobiotin synthetase